MFGASSCTLRNVFVQVAHVRKLFIALLARIPLSLVHGPNVVVQDSHRRTFFMALFARIPLPLMHGPNVGFQVVHLRE